ncbi:MAG: hypothetical protein PUB97_09385 [Ruminococcus sp.]|nr:hypothetical protein [Ruminococcus sp.]
MVLLFLKPAASSENAANSALSNSFTLCFLAKGPFRAKTSFASAVSVVDSVAASVVVADSAVVSVTVSVVAALVVVSVAASVVIAYEDFVPSVTKAPACTIASSTESEELSFPDAPHPTSDIESIAVKRMLLTYYFILLATCNFKYSTFGIIPQSAAECNTP